MPLLGASAFGVLDLEIDLYTAAILNTLRLRDYCRLSGRPVVILVMDVLLDKQGFATRPGNFPKKFGRLDLIRTQNRAIRQSGDAWWGRDTAQARAHF